MLFSVLLVWPGSRRPNGSPVKTATALGFKGKCFFMYVIMRSAGDGVCPDLSLG